MSIQAANAPATKAHAGQADFLRVSGVNKNFGGLQALKDCSFSVEPNRITCLVGPNGAGKTSVFNVITGFLTPDTGTVTFRGQSLNGRSPQEIVSLGIARTFQNLRLFGDMSVIENVLVFMPGHYGEGVGRALLRPFASHRDHIAKQQAAREILRQVGLAERASERVRNLSYGDQKLLCIARALATGADVLLLDEPASGLSTGALAAAMALMRRLCDAGKTLLVVEHNTRVVQQIADDVLFLHHGHLLATGTPQEITSDAALAEIYFGGVIGGA
jgi:ABC-type branched-subunit amino acid transport system ATPase component